MSFIVDLSDKERVEAFNWYVDSRSGYWRRTKDGLTLHVFLLGPAPNGLYWDHIDGDKSNNSRSNFRLATPSQSQANKPKTVSKTTSQFKGVYKHGKNDRWIAQIKVNKRAIYLGSFVDEKDAAIRYDEAARIVYGEYAKTNF